MLRQALDEAEAQQQHAASAATTAAAATEEDAQRQRQAVVAVDEATPSITNYSRPHHQQQRNNANENDSTAAARRAASHHGGGGDDEKSSLLSSTSTSDVSAAGDSNSSMKQAANRISRRSRTAPPLTVSGEKKQPPPLVATTVGSGGGGKYGSTGSFTGSEQHGGKSTDDEHDTNSSLDDDDDGDDEEDDDWDDDEDDEDDDSSKRSSWPSSAWHGLKNIVIVVANVENLWDDNDYQSVDDGEAAAAVVARAGDVTPPSLTSSPLSGRQTAESIAAQQPQQQRSFKNKVIVLIWFVILAMSYCGERSTFKLLVDRAGPFRLFAVQMLTVTHAFMVAAGMLISSLWCTGNNTGGGRNNQQQYAPPEKTFGLGIPIVDVGFMALLDTINLLLVFLTAIHVPPTLTVILVQFTLPLTALFTQFVHPDGRCNCCSRAACSGSDESLSPSTDCYDDTGAPQNTYGSTATTTSTSARSGMNRPSSEDYTVTTAQSGEGVPTRRWGGLSLNHVWGSVVISLAVLLAMLPACYSIFNPFFFLYADTIPMRTAYNTLLYVCACIPAAASQLYKEHVFCHYKQPVNVSYLNLLLSVFQFIFALVLSPMLFTLQGIGARTGKGGDSWTKLYPSSTISQNFLDGLRCFFFALSDDDQENKYFEDARCDYTLGLVILYAFSIISVGVAVDKIVNAGATKVMYRGVSAGIIVAVLCMHAYDMRLPDFNYGPAIDALNLASLIVLILGSEVYHRTALQDSTFETIYPEVENLYDEELY